MCRKLTLSFLAIFILGGAINSTHANYLTVMYATGREHSCDAPILAPSIHQEHGYGNCGNTASTSETTFGHEENCSDTSTTINGVLWHGEWLTCGDGDGPNGTKGCDYQVVVRCQGQISSHEFLLGTGLNGLLPACGYIAEEDEYVCANGITRQYCYCEGTSFLCTPY